MVNGGGEAEGLIVGCGERGHAIRDLGRRGVGVRRLVPAAMSTEQAMAVPVEPGQGVAGEIADE